MLQPDSQPNNHICVLSVHGYSYVMLGAKCLLGYEVSTGMRYV